MVYVRTQKTKHRRFEVRLYVSLKFPKKTGSNYAKRIHQLEESINKI